MKYITECVPNSWVRFLTDENARPVNDGDDIILDAVNKFLRLKCPKECFLRDVNIMFEGECSTYIQLVYKYLK